MPFLSLLILSACGAAPKVPAAVHPGPPMLPGPAVPREFYDYLGKPDPSYEAKIVSRDADGMTVSMTSQTWRGIPWRHMILIHQPSKLSAKGAGILYITGDGPFQGDYKDIGLVSEATGMPVAMLFSEPNQPLFGLREDDLIAHTFAEYLSSGDATWPLLFPMAKSALRAMDAVEWATRGTNNPLKRFVVTGASKRGWTTWFVGAARDRRVIGIAPLVYDNLNVLAQMPHQIDSWGQYSDMIQDYTRRGLQQKLSTPEGRRLGLMIDPYTYRSNIRVPTLVVKGANDPYWAADATSLYWNDLKQPHWLFAVPNAGHDLAGGILAAFTIGAFARSCAGEFKMPNPAGSVDVDTQNVHWSIVRPTASDPALAEAGVWLATSPTLDFRKAVYRRVDVLTADRLTAAKGTTVDSRFPRPPGNLAIIVEFRYRTDGRAFSLSLPTQIVRQS